MLQAPDGPIDLSNFVEDEWDIFCKKMATPGEWANHVVAVATVHMLRIPLRIFMSSPTAETSGQESVFITFDDKQNYDPKKVILLGHRYENHYQSLEPQY